MSLGTRSHLLLAAASHQDDEVASESRDSFYSFVEFNARQGKWIARQRVFSLSPVSVCVPSGQRGMRVPYSPILYCDSLLFCCLIRGNKRGERQGSRGIIPILSSYSTICTLLSLRILVTGRQMAGKKSEKSSSSPFRPPCQSLLELPSLLLIPRSWERERKVRSLRDELLVLIDPLSDVSILQESASHVPSIRHLFHSPPASHYLMH